MADYQDVFSDEPVARRSYYDRGSNGDVDWMDWLLVFFFMLATWMIGQFVFTAPIGAMFAEYDPEASAAANEAMQAAMLENPVPMMLIGLGFLLMGLGGPVAAVAGLVHYLGERGRASKITGAIGAIVAIAGLFLMMGNQGALMEAGADDMLSVMGVSPLAYALFLLTFPAALVGLYFGWKVAHRKSLTALHTSFARFRWGRALQAGLITWAVLFAFSFVGGAVTGNAPAWQFDASRFFIFALISLTLLPIQSATEEIVVRGYMNKGLVEGLGNKWVAFVITSGLFTALHLANPEATAGAEAGNLAVVMSGYFFFGFAACLMVLIDDGLESAIGVHAANNTFAGVFVNYEGSVLPTPSLWQVRAEPTTDSVATILVLSAILGLLWVTRRRSLSHPQTL